MWIERQEEGNQAHAFFPLDPFKSESGHGLAECNLFLPSFLTCLPSQGDQDDKVTRLMNTKKEDGRKRGIND